MGAATVSEAFWSGFLVSRGSRYGDAISKIQSLGNSIDQAVKFGFFFFNKYI